MRLDIRIETRRVIDAPIQADLAGGPPAKVPLLWEARVSGGYAAGVERAATEEEAVHGAIMAIARRHGHDLHDIMRSLVEIHGADAVQDSLVAAMSKLNISPV